MTYSLCQELDPALLIRRLKKEVAELKDLNHWILPRKWPG